MAKVAEVTIKGCIINFRVGPKTQKNDELIIEIPNMNSKSEASKYIGRKVIIELNNKKIIGKIVATHGSRGKLRARFRRGLPGQILGAPVMII